MGYWNSAAMALTNLNTVNYWNSSLPSFTLGTYSTTSSYAPILTFNQKFNLGLSSGTSYKFNYDFSYKPFSGYNVTPISSTPTYSSFAPSTTYIPSNNKIKFGSLTQKTNLNIAGNDINTRLGANRKVKYCGLSSEYANLSKNAALQKARTDSRLEYIGNGGIGWTISDASFQNDIKYATVGTTALMNEVVSEIRKTDPNFRLVVTSALGTAKSPHGKNAGHYNLASVKLDFGGGLSRNQAAKIADQLEATGKFDYAHIECDGKTYHIDAQFKKELLT